MWGVVFTACVVFLFFFCKPVDAIQVEVISQGLLFDEGISKSD
jgi:hypothetical protein